MKSLLIAASILISFNAFSWVDNEADFAHYPHYQDIVDALCLNCGPNEGGYVIFDISTSDDTEAESCYFVEYAMTYDDDFGPIDPLDNQDVYTSEELCFDNF